MIYANANGQIVLSLTDAEREAFNRGETVSTKIKTADGLATISVTMQYPLLLRDRFPQSEGFSLDDIKAYKPQSLADLYDKSELGCYDSDEQFLGEIENLHGRVVLDIYRKALSSNGVSTDPLRRYGDAIQFVTARFGRSKFPER